MTAGVCGLTQGAVEELMELMKSKDYSQCLLNLAVASFGVCKCLRDVGHWSSTAIRTPMEKYCALTCV